MLTIVPFVVIPVALGTAATLLLVNVFPARRARDFLMLTGLLFAASLVVLLRYIRPERLMRVESLPDVTGFFATLQSPITPLLPSFWAGETLFAACRVAAISCTSAALWTTALSLILVLRRGARTLALHRLQQRPGGAQGAIHAASQLSSDWRDMLPLSRAGGTSS